jgi:hypothetical protein
MLGEERAQGFCREFWNGNHGLSAQDEAPQVEISTLGRGARSASGPSKQIFVLEKQDFAGPTGTGLSPPTTGIANLRAVPNAQLARRMSGGTARRVSGHGRAALILGAGFAGLPQGSIDHSQSITTSTGPMFVVDDPKMQWKPIATAPFDRDLELVVIDSAGVHALSFPCRRTAEGWLNVETGKSLYNTRPTHWREWPSEPEPTS